MSNSSKVIPISTPCITDDDLLFEQDHGFGINRPILIAERDALEAVIDRAALEALMLGISEQRFLELCRCSHENILLDHLLNR